MDARSRARRLSQLTIVVIAIQIVACFAIALSPKSVIAQDKMTIEELVDSNSVAMESEYNHASGSKENSFKNDLDEFESVFSVHGQTTIVSQYHSRFHAPYSGIHSLVPFHEVATSQTSTLFLGARLYDGGELFFNPEVAGGRGLSGVSGVGGFPNGEITRVGLPQPTPYVARTYFTQTIGLGGEREKVNDGPNSVAGYRDVNRIGLTLGKLAATDFIDNNAFNHDPRTQFLNWALLYNGAWDYPADVRGYTYGGVAELNREQWAIRYGLFGEPTEANGAVIDSHFDRAHGHAWEMERRNESGGLSGHLRLLAFLNRANMGDYQQATTDPAAMTDITTTRRYRSKYGFGYSWDQELSEDLGFFSRAGWNDGRTESWAFTEIDRTFTVGARIKGTRWRRKDDEIGLGIAVNGLSPQHRAYLAAGGLGFILGDGKLNYGLENAYETYYRWKISSNIFLTANFQLIVHPGFNQDRGPVFLEALRAHAEF